MTRVRRPFLLGACSLVLVLAAGSEHALAQLANPLSNAAGYANSGNTGYTLSKLANPTVTSIATTGTAAAPGDDGEVPVNIGFNFSFFNQVFTDVQVNGNGHIYLGTGYNPELRYLPGAQNNSAHPEDNGGVIHLNYDGPRIDFGWDDWDVTSAETTNAGGGIYTQTRGAVGSREFVVEYNNVAHFGEVGTDSIQLILHEGSNNITMHYIDVDGPFDNGFAVGIQKNDFTYLQYLYVDGEALSGTGKPANGESLRWTPSPSAPTMEVVIDRVTGRVTLENNTGVAQSIKGYEISSPDGPFDPSDAPFLADGDPNWVRLTAANGSDLSEGHLTTGTIAAGAKLDFGPGAWLRYYKEDVEFKFVNSSGAVIRGPVTFTGDAGAGDGPFEFIDLNFDGNIDIQDWVTFRDNVGNDLSTLTSVAKLYRNSDLNADGVHSTRDFLIFKQAFDAANGAGALAAAIASLPEPSAVALLGIVGLSGALVRPRRRHDRQALVTTAASSAASLRTALLAGLVGTALTLFTPSTSSAQLPLFFEDFESVVLGPNQEEAVQGDNVWSDVAPSGWVIDRTGVPGYNEPPENNGVREWIGWSFADRDWWVEAAGDQDRSQFTNASGTVMVADPDEWDDAAHPDSAANGWYNTYASTPAISLAGLPANVVQLRFDSSWRPEFDDNYHQTANLTVSYDGGPEVEIFRWESDPASANFKDDAQNESVSVNIANPAGANSMVLKFGLFDAGNDWWWAVDNIDVSAVGDPVTLEVNTTTGAMTLKSSTLPSTLNSYNIVSAGASLNATGWNAGNLASQAGGGGSLASDFDSSGVVDNADVQAFADGFGTTSGATKANGDADGDGDVDGRDFLQVQRDFGLVGGAPPGEQWEVLTGSSKQLFEAYLSGSTSIAANASLSIGNGYNTAVNAQDLTFVYTTPAGIELQGLVTYVSGVQATSAIPEPSALGLTALATVVGAALSRRRKPCKTQSGAATMSASYSRGRASAGAVACLALWAASAHAQTNDRLYKLGDSEPTGGAGSIVGAAAGAFSTTWDDAGLPGQNQLHDLSPFNAPRYAAISGRPDGVTGLGVRFVGSSSQYLRGPRLGAPSSSIASTTQPGGTLDYFDLSTRGMAFWVLPEAAAGAQSIVMDTNQHGVRINEQGYFSMRYNSRDYDTTIQATPGVWHHVEVVAPTSGGSLMYINGNGAAYAAGGYNVGDNAPLIVGANTGGTPDDFEGGSAEFFTGIVDDLSLYVFGTSDAGTQFGEYNFIQDNARAKAVLGTSPNLLDINRDGSVSGNGTGPASTDDVSAFVAGWQFRNYANGVLLGGLNTIAKGDINVDGITDIRDWALLNAANPAMGAAALRALTGSVPEPSASLLALVGLLGAAGRSRVRR